MEWLIEQLKEFLLGVLLLVGISVFIYVYIWFSSVSEEDSPRGRLFKKIGNITSATFFIYLAIISFGVPLIALIVWLFT